MRCQEATQRKQKLYDIGWASKILEKAQIPIQRICHKYFSSHSTNSRSCTCFARLLPFEEHKANIFYQGFIHTTEAAETLPAFLYITAKICNLALSKRCLKSWCRKVAVEINCTFQQSSSKRRRRIQSLRLIPHMSLKRKRFPAVPAVLNRFRRIPQSIKLDLRDKKESCQEATQKATKNVEGAYRKMIEI